MWPHAHPLLHAFTHRYKQTHTQPDTNNRPESHGSNERQGKFDGQILMHWWINGWKHRWTNQQTTTHEDRHTQIDRRASKLTDIQTSTREDTWRYRQPNSQFERRACRKATIQSDSHPAKQTDRQQTSNETTEYGPTHKQTNIYTCTHPDRQTNIRRPMQTNNQPEKYKERRIDKKTGRPTEHSKAEQDKSGQNRPSQTKVVSKHPTFQGHRQTGRTQTKTQSEHDKQASIFARKQMRAWF